MVCADDLPLTIYSMKFTNACFLLCLAIHTISNGMSEYFFPFPIFFMLLFVNSLFTNYRVLFGPPKYLVTCDQPVYN